MIKRLPVAVLACGLTLGLTGAAERDPIEKQVVSLAIAGQFEEALDLLDILLNRDPKNPLYLYYTGLCFMHLERLDLSVSYLEKSVREEAPFPEAYYWLAQVYVGRDKQQEAQKWVREGLLRYPHNRKLKDLDRDLAPGLKPAPSPAR